MHKWKGFLQEENWNFLIFSHCSNFEELQSSCSYVKAFLNPWSDWKICEMAFEVSDIIDECHFLSLPPTLVKVQETPTSVKEKVFFPDFLDAEPQESFFL